MAKYFSGPGANFGPPSGLAGLLMQDRQMGTSGLAEGMKRFEEVADKYRKVQDMGKAADYFVKAGGDQVLGKLGMMQEQWDTLGAREKSAAVTGLLQADARNQVQQELKMKEQALEAERMVNMARLGEVSRAQGADQAFGSAMRQAQGKVAVDTLNQGNGPRIPRAMTPQDFASVAPAEAWTSRQAGPMVEALARGARGTDPATAMNAEANMINARVNLERATKPKAAPQTELPAGLPSVPGYAPVPDGKGGFKYLASKPSREQELEMSRLRTQRASLQAQVNEYDAQLAQGKSSTGMLGFGKKYADLRNQAVKALEDIDARMADLAQPGTAGGAGASGGASGGSDLWQDFLKARGK